MIAQGVAGLVSNLKSGVKSFAPVLVLVVYTLLGALLMMVLEGPNEEYELLKLKEEREKLLENTAFRLNNLKTLGPIQAYNHTIKTLIRFQDKLGVDPVNLEERHWSIWGAIFYCMTVYTTIGYGNIVPVTTAGRVFTILYAFLGIPLTVLCLYALGQLLAKICKLLWKAVLKTTSVVSEDMSKELDKKVEMKDNEKEKDDLMSFPVSILVIVTVLWVLACAGLFLLWEDWDYGTSLYFTLISFTTIGFGDVLPSEYDYMIIVGILLIIGLSIVSTMMAIIQQQIEELGQGLQDNIHKEYLTALAEAKDEGEVSEKKAAAAAENHEGEETAVNVEEQELDKKTLNAVVSRMSPWSRALYYVMPESKKKELEKTNESYQGKKTRSSQTDASLLQPIIEEYLLKQNLAGPMDSSYASSTSPNAHFLTSLQ